MAETESILACRARWVNALVNGKSVEQFTRATLATCRDAIEQLGDQLAKLGYPLREFLRPITADLSPRIARIEKHTGLHLPLIVSEFWKTVGGISLVDLDNYEHVAFWEELGISGAKQFCDGIHVDSCDDEWATFTINDFDDCVEDDDEFSFMYTLAPDGYHKDDISGGAPYGLGRNSDWAPTWENFYWAGYRRPVTAVADPTDFVSYLRTAILECGGFPGLFGHPEFEKIRRQLIDDLPVF